jgi:L1 cell adhesion molecule like protein
MQYHKKKLQIIIISIDASFEAIDFKTTIKRAKFEQLNSDLFRSSMDPVKSFTRCKIS